LIRQFPEIGKQPTAERPNNLQLNGIFEPFSELWGRLKKNFAEGSIFLGFAANKAYIKRSGWKKQKNSMAIDLFNGGLKSAVKTW
jgi:hypothetical protein